MRQNRWRPGRSTPKVRGGKVQKKHRHDRYVKSYPRVEGELPIVCEPALRGFRHTVAEDELRRFLRIVPDFEHYGAGLRCLVLGDGEDDCFGWNWDGVICLNAWDDFQQEWDEEFFAEHRHVLDRLLVPYEIVEGGADCRFEKKTAGAFQLMHVFLHELGHHYDTWQTRLKSSAARGEEFAEGFGNRIADTMWAAFYREFGF